MTAAPAILHGAGIDDGDIRFSFGIVKAAQTRKDFQVLARRGPHVLSVHHGPDLDAGISIDLRVISEGR
jgi:hypothetical protein